MLKDHEIRELINELTDLARDNGANAQIRHHIWEIVYKYIEKDSHNENQN